MASTHRKSMRHPHGGFKKQRGLKIFQIVIALYEFNSYFHIEE